MLALMPRLPKFRRNPGNNLIERRKRKAICNQANECDWAACVTAILESASGYVDRSQAQMEIGITRSTLAMTTEAPSIESDLRIDSIPACYGD
jgi:hypothetical protein